MQPSLDPHYRRHFISRDGKATRPWAGPIPIYLHAPVPVRNAAAYNECSSCLVSGIDGVVSQCGDSCENVARQA